MFGDKLKNSLEKIISKDQKGEGNDKKKIENLVFFVIILIITIMIINIIWNGKKETTKQENNSYSKELATQELNIKDNTGISDISTESLENKLEQILSKIQGVGDVRVCINYSETSEVVAMYNENSKTSNTEESDTSGGTRKIQENDSQKEIVYKEENGEKVPITQKIIKPKIEGAIIIAKGANSADTKTNIIQAVEAVTGLATHKIQVFEMN